MNKYAKAALYTGGGFALLLAGSAIGQAGAEVPETVTKTVTVETPGPEVTKTETVTPEACIEALTLAEEVTDTNAAALGLAGELIGLGPSATVADYDQFNEDLAPLTKDLGPLVADYNEAAETCRESS